MVSTQSEVFVLLWCFLPLMVAFVIGEPLYDLTTCSWALKAFIKSLYENEAVDSWYIILLELPPGQKVSFSCAILTCFCSRLAVFVAEDTLCDLKTPYQALKTSLKITKWIWSGWLPKKQLLENLPEQKMKFLVYVDMFWQRVAAFVVEELLYDLKTPSWILKTLHKII